MNDNAERWHHELAAGSGAVGNPFAADADIYIINFSRGDLRDPGGAFGVPAGAERVGDPFMAGSPAAGSGPRRAPRPDFGVYAPA